LLNTHERCFEMPHEESASKIRHTEGRQQNQRNNETFGKNYNIITNCEIGVVPPSVPEKVFERRNHPSMNPGTVPPHVTWVDPPL
jgi:hypothetical protein